MGLIAFFGVTRLKNSTKCFNCEKLSLKELWACFTKLPIKEIHNAENPPAGQPSLHLYSHSLTIAAAQDRKSADEEQALRSLANQYFAAFRSKEAAKPMSFWSTKSRDLATRRQR